MLNGKQILFVDDEPYYTRPYRMMLQHAGATVHYKETFSEAENLVSAHPEGLAFFHCLIVDLQMPRPERMSDADQNRFASLSGLWFLSELAPQIKRNPGLGVVILTNVAVERFEGPLRDLGLPALQLEMRRKIDLPAKDLPGLLAALLARLA